MSVADSMVCRKRGSKNRLRGNLALRRPGTLNDFAESHNRDLGRINDAKNSFHSLLAETRNRNGGVAQLGTPQRTCARSLNYIAKIFHEFAKALAIGVMQR